MRLGTSAIPALVLVLSSAGCGSDAAPAWHDEAGYRWRELEVAGGRGGFTPLGARTGIRFQNTVSESLLVANRMLGQGAGVALGDVDGDGRVDIFLARTDGANALYRNLGDWRFEDIGVQAGVATPDRHTSGAALSDIDGDGDLDLILLATLGPNAVFRNDGRGRFTEDPSAGLDTVGRGGTTIAMADTDRDGDLDLYIANYKPYSPVDRVSPQQRAFNQLVRQVGPGQYEVVPQFERDFKLVMRPDMGGLNLSMRGEPDDYYVNEGGRFQRVPLTGGRFRDAAGESITEAAESFTLGARFADVNGDLAPDLYLANDFEDRDQLWIGDGAGGFRLADWTAQRQLSNSSMGVDIGDVSGDGLADLFVVDMLSNDSRRLKTQMPTHTALPKLPGDAETQLQQQRNTLFLNRGDGTFAEIGMLAGVHATGWSWSTMLLDVDLDGWQDILVANGHLWDVMDADTQERLQNRLTDVPWQRQRWEFPPLPLRNVALRNRGDLTFEDVSERWRFGIDEDISHAMAAGDLDGDGDPDVVVNRLGAPALVLRNDASAPRIAVRLIGPVPNTRAVGAKLRLTAPGMPVQEREIAVGGLYLAHSDFTVAFAMPGVDSASLTVTWPDGRQTVLPAVRPNRLYEITASTGTDRDPSAARDSHLPLFDDATSELGGHRHVDAAFDDWERQFLLPNSLSHLGPGVAWFDVDRDGDEDLFVGTGRGGRPAMFRNDGTRLVSVRTAGEIATADLTAIVGYVDGRDGTHVLTGIASWEHEPHAPSPPPSVAFLSVGQRILQELRAAVPPRDASTGPIALGDYDGDGDLDLFVGGRAIPAQYPRAASSALYRNDGASFVLDREAAALDQIGLVSAALFADVDGDADADLLLAREWDSIVLWVNDGGRFRDASASWGLARWTGRWNGLAAGDLDADGRLDLVATSWGRNTATPTDSMRPLMLVHGPFGSRGEEELLLARYDARLRAVAPLNSYPRVRVALPDLTQRVTSFAEYADASVEQVLGAKARTVSRKSIATLDQMVFLNRGSHFDARPLPLEAQMTPAFAVGVADFNGDGAEDVVVSQNFYPTALGLPRYDSGRGLLLLGDGRGGLVPMPGGRSGLVTYGDQRGAAYADADGDGRLDLVIAQNAGLTRLFRNRRATPGLRVRLRGRRPNVDGVGSQIRLAYGDSLGPIREVHAGSGYWSQNGAVQVLGMGRGRPSAVIVRWPGGGVTRTAVPVGAREVVVAQDQ